jgi:hypothetical protein
MHCCSDFFITGRGVFEEVLISETGSEFGLVLDFLFVGLDKIDGFGQRVVISAEEAILLQFCVLHSTIGPKFN